MKLKRRNRIFKLVKKHPNYLNLKAYYTKFRNKLHNSIRQLRENFYKMKLNSCRGDSKQTWKVLNEITGQTKEANNNNFKIQINDNTISELKFDIL